MRIVTSAACALSAGAMMMAGTALAQSKTIDLKAGNGSPMGSATVTVAPTGVLIRLDVKGLPAGWHGLHLHEKGDCSAADFASAGAHINHTPDKKPHGLLNPGGPDFGDLPNLYAGADGTAHAEVFTNLVKATELMDADGSSIIIHANPDDHSSQPIGGAGTRVACGVIK